MRIPGLLQNAHGGTRALRTLPAGCDKNRGTMSNRCLDAVFQHSASKGSARLVLISMADEANDEGMLTAYRRSLSWLAHKANVDKATAKRAVATLVELGEVRVLEVGDGRRQSDYQLLLPGLKDARGAEGTQPAPPERAARVGKPPTEGAQADPPRQPGSTPVDPEPPAAEGSDEHVGHDIVRAFYDWCTANDRPKPTLPAGRQGNQFMALVHIVQALLAAGWTVPEVKVALTQTRAFTTDAMTYTLSERRQQQQRPASGPRAPVDDDRGAPSGTLDL